MTHEYRLKPIVLAACLTLIHPLGIRASDEPASAPSTAPADELPADAVANRALLARLGHGFRAEHNDSFTLLTPCPPEKSAALLRLADSTRRAILSEMDILNVTTTPPRHKMIIVQFDRWSAFLDFAKDSGFTPTEGIPGFYDEPRRRCLVFDIDSLPAVRRQRDAIARARSKRDEIEMQGAHAALLKTEIAAAERSLAATVTALTSLVIQHEIAHQFLAEHGVVDARAPRWLREGLAMRYEHATAGANHAPDANSGGQDADATGRASARKADFLQAQDRHGALDAAHLRRALSDDAYLSPTGDDAAYRYAVAWAVVDYLLKHRTAECREFLNAAQTGKPPAADTALVRFEQHFGPADGALAAAIRKHVEGLP